MTSSTPTPVHPTRTEFIIECGGVWRQGRNLVSTLVIFLTAALVAAYVFTLLGAHETAVAHTPVERAPGTLSSAQPSLPFPLRPLGPHSGRAWLERGELWVRVSARGEPQHERWSSKFTAVGLPPPIGFGKPSARKQSQGSSKIGS